MITDKRDDFTFEIVKFSRKKSQIVRYFRICSDLEFGWFHRKVDLNIIDKFVTLGFYIALFKSRFRTFTCYYLLSIIFVANLIL